MDKKEEFYLITAIYISMADGSLDDNEISTITSSKLFKPFISVENIKFCGDKIKNLLNQKLDIITFLKDELIKVDLNKTESRTLIKELIKISYADGDFCQDEKYLIKLLCAEFSIDDKYLDSLIDEFSKKLPSNKLDDKDGNDKIKAVSKGLKLNKSELNFVYDNKQDEILNVITDKVKEDIKEEIGISDFKITISDTKIKKVNRLVVDTLLDERTTNESSEINYSGIKERRKISESQIDLWKNERSDYEYNNLSKKIIFRVDGTNETYTCSQCNGSKKNTCYTCSGSGKNRCTSCSGRGEKRCSSCGGSSETRCWSCSGSGRKSTTRDGRTVSSQCSSCGGRGRNPCSSCGNGYVTCTTCSGQGQVTCSTCTGRGEIPCSRCDAQGYFTSFYNIHSVLYSLSDEEFLNGVPDKNYCSRTIKEEKFDYEKSFGKYSFKSLKEYFSDLKNIFSTQKFEKNQSPKIIKFQLDECISMSFKINIGESVYIGGLSNNGSIFYDKSILSQLFFKVINSFDVTKNFNSLTKIKGTFINQISQFEKTFVKITEFNKFYKIIKSDDKLTIRLNKTRKVKLVNTKKYLEFLANKLKSKLMKILVPFLVISHIGFFVFALEFSNNPILWSLLAFILNLLITRFSFFANIDDHKPNNDAKNVVSGAITLALIIIVIFAFMVYWLGFEISF